MQRKETKQFRDLSLEAIVDEAIVDRFDLALKPASKAGSIWAACTSSGMSIQTGPRRPAFARWTAFSRW